MAIPWQKKLILTGRLFLTGDGYKKAELLKENLKFGYFGEHVYWFTRNIPSDPEYVFLGNNIKIAAGVYFCTHDIIELMLNDNKIFTTALSQKTGIKQFARKKGNIIIHDNVFIGAYTTLMYNINIGNNVIIAANSVVTKDIPNNSVVAGSPARIIGTFDDFLNKRIDWMVNCQEK